MNKQQSRNKQNRRNRGGDDPHRRVTAAIEARRTMPLRICTAAGLRYPEKGPRTPEDWAAVLTTIRNWES